MRPILTLTVAPQGHLVGGIILETDLKLPDDNVGFGVAHLGDGTFVVAASVKRSEAGRP